MDFTAILVPIACGCVLPILLLWFIIRKEMNETNKRTQIMLAAIEKNPDMDIEELFNKMAPKQKLLKEKLLSKLQWGSICTMIGIGLLGCGIYSGTNDEDFMTLLGFGFVLLAIGIAFLVNYFFGKKMLAKEIEAEERRMFAQS